MMPAKRPKTKSQIYRYRFLVSSLRRNPRTMNKIANAIRTAPKTKEPMRETIMMVVKISVKTFVRKPRIPRTIAHLIEVGKAIFDFVYIVSFIRWFN